MDWEKGAVMRVEKDRSGLQRLAAGVIDQALADVKNPRSVYRAEAIRFLDSKGSLK